MRCSHCQISSSPRVRCSPSALHTQMALLLLLLRVVRNSDMSTLGSSRNFNMEPTHSFNMMAPSSLRIPCLMLMATQT